MSLLDEGQGICQRENARKNDHVLWEDRLDHEKAPEREIRHRRARILCNRCPALEECEERLSRYEAEGIHIAGVVAGRYTTVRAGFESCRQTHCAGCGHYLKIRFRPAMPGGKSPKQPPGALEHAGEGLCVNCYPMLKRRKNEKPRV